MQFLSLFDIDGLIKKAFICSLQKQSKMALFYSFFLNPILDNFCKQNKVSSLILKDIGEVGKCGYSDVCFDFFFFSKEDRKIGMNCKHA